MLPNPDQPAAWGAAAARLRTDAAAAEVLRAFESAAVHSLLLKGPSFLRWLYGEGETRSYTDVDLLLKPGDGDAAAQVLRSLGFEPELDQTKMPDWWREHGLSWTRAKDWTSVDVHSTVPGVGADDEKLWSVLSEGSTTLTVGKYPARVLSIPGRAMHLALHAAQHGRAGIPVIQELELALARADRETWRAAARMAKSLQATAAFAAGLRLADTGNLLADELELPSSPKPELALRVGSAPAPALTLERLARARGVRDRTTILRHKLVPPPTFMRRWYPRAERGRLWLLVAYAWRPLWLAGQAPRALRARRSAGRDFSALPDER